MNKKIGLLIFIFCFLSECYSVTPAVKEIEFKNFCNTYGEYIEPIVSELSNMLSVNPENINVENNSKIFSLEYLNHEPILLVYYDDIFSIFGLKKYLCICLKQPENNKVIVNVFECKTMNPFIKIPDSTR